MLNNIQRNSDVANDAWNGNIKNLSVCLFHANRRCEDTERTNPQESFSLLGIFFYID